MAINLSDLKNKAANNQNQKLKEQAATINQNVNVSSSTINSSVPNMMNDSFYVNLDKPSNGSVSMNNDFQTMPKSNPDLLRKDPRINDIPLSDNHLGHDFVADSNPYAKVEEKVAHLSLQVNQVIIRPYLQQALDYLKNSKVDAINAYNQLSDEIANEIKIISQNTNVISNRLREAKNIINKTQEVIRNRYNNATEEEIASANINLDYEYNVVAEHYELTLQLSQELAKYKSRIDTLLSSQNLLDESIVPSISRIQLEIDNLQLLLHSLDSSDYATIIAKKTGRNISNLNYNQPPMVARGKELNNLVEQTSVYNYNSLNTANTPNLANMNRAEDPNAYLNINRNPVNGLNNNANANMYSNVSAQQQTNVGMNQQQQQMPNNNQANQANQAMMNQYNDIINQESKKIADSQRRIEEVKRMLQSQANQQPMMQNSNQMMTNNSASYNMNYGPMPMSRKEMRMQRKLQRQQMKMNKYAMDPAMMSSNVSMNNSYNDDLHFQNMQKQYSDNLAQMQKIQASNINIQNDLVQMQQERQLKLQEQMQQQFANMMQQQQMQAQMVQQFYQSMQQPVLNMGMVMTNPTTGAYPVYQQVPAMNSSLNSSSSLKTNVTSSTVNANNSSNVGGHTVIEKKMAIDTLEENLAKSPRDKIFVVRTGEPVSVAQDNLRDARNLRTIKVIR